MATSSDRVFGPRVFGPLVRIGHWAGALAFLVAYVTAGRPLPLHTRIGYALAAYAIWRLVWGMIGPSRARFGELFSTPRAYLDDISALARGRPIRHEGLGPVGTLLAVAMLVSICATSAVGVVTLAVRHGDGPLAPILGTVPEPLPKAITEYGTDGGTTIIPRTDRAAVDVGPEHPDVKPGRAAKRLHGTLSLLALWLAVIHVLHVLYASVGRGENLLFDMVTGSRAAHPPPEPEPVARPPVEPTVPAASATADPAASRAIVVAAPPAAAAGDEPDEGDDAEESDDERARRKLLKKAARKERRREAR
jgi:cytochrome b